MTDERDPRDGNVETAWRKHVRDEPPRALDDAIRAAAHRAVQSGPRAAGKPPRRAWTAWAPLAVAATLGAIALGVIQLAPRDTDATHDVVSDAAPTNPPSTNARTQRPSPIAQPSVPAAPSAAAPGVPPAPSTTMSADPATRPAAPPLQPATTPPPPVAIARKNEGEREARAAAAPSAGRDSAVGALAPRSADAQSQVPSAHRAQTKKLAANETPNPFPAAGTAERPAEATDKPDAKRAMAANRMEGASREAPAAAAPSAMAAPARKEQSGEPPVDPVRRKDAAPFADRSGDRAGTPAAAPAQPAPAPGAASRAAPSVSEEAAVGAQALAKTAPLRTPDDYFGAIRRLRDEGREGDAIAMLAAYRAAFGDDEQKLPGDLRLWAMRVTRP